MFIVQLEPGVWLADGEGDPPRTLDRQQAEPYATPASAGRALLHARKFRPFDSARIERV